MDLANKELKRYFTESEITTIKKFAAWVVAKNRAEQSEFSDAEETDDEIREEVVEWLARRRRMGHGNRRG